MAAETNFGDGRSGDDPLAVGPLGPDGEASTRINPSFVSISDGTNTASVITSGSGQSSVLVRDRYATKLLELILLELKQLNGHGP